MAWWRKVKATERPDDLVVSNATRITFTAAANPEEWIHLEVNRGQLAFDANEDEFCYMRPNTGSWWYMSRAEADQLATWIRDRLQDAQGAAPLIAIKPKAREDR